MATPATNQAPSPRTSLALPLPSRFGDLSSANMAASGTLTVGGASTLTGAVSAGDTLAVTGATTLTGQLNANGGAKLAGSAPAAAADAVGLGVADINGATTGAIKEVFEGGGTLTRRVYSAAGAVKMLIIDEAVADDATIRCPCPLRAVGDARHRHP